MQKFLRLIARLVVARHECMYMYARHCKENAPIYMYYVAPETPMMSSVIADCPALAPLQYFGQVYAYACGTPLSTVLQLECLSPTPTFCLLPNNQL